MLCTITHLEMLSIAVEKNPYSNFCDICLLSSLVMILEMSLSQYLLKCDISHISKTFDRIKGLNITNIKT